MTATTPSPLPLMELSSGLFVAKTLSVAVRLGLFALIDEQGALTAAEFATRKGLHPRPAEMLLTGCVSLGLLVKNGDRYGNSALAGLYLVPGGRYYFGDYLMMLDGRAYGGWMRLAEAVEENQPTTWDPRVQESIFDAGDPKMVELFWRGMHSLAVFTARALAEAYDFSGVRRLLDVGGGGAAYTIELCRAYPDLTATVFDLPFVCEQTTERIAEAGLSDRITCVGGDFFTDDLPAGHDVALLSSVMHDWSEQEDLSILRRVRAALPSGGRIIISELLMDDDKTGPVPAAMFNLLMLVETQRGWNYTGAEYTRWLREVGCTDVTRVDVHGLSANGVIVGTVG
ncbi:methyltransferase [Actinocrispum sp. NPDC049592]|uniref:methyltransferase n=1 Tax=Actinocrispum sp. NPDC049592 TaxID=3154835 RepID=UPI00343A1D70